MKTKNNKLNFFRSLKPKLLTVCVSALGTGMVLSSVVQASDIDVYQQAKSGDITLMMLFDISGSMGAPQLTGDASACDIPSSITSVYDSGSIVSTNGIPTYTRYYCTVKNDVYFYRSTGSGSAIKYFKCGDSGTTSANSCSIEIDSLPADAAEMSTSTSGAIVNYYKKKQTDRYYDRITRLKDAMFDLLNGNSAKGITAISDDKIIGLSAYSFNGIGGNGFVLVPARKLGDDVVMNGITRKHRAVLLDAVANKLYARGGTPTGNAYAEAAAYLMGTKTFNDGELTNFTSGSGAQVYFSYTSGSTTYYTQCNTWNTSGQCTEWPGSSNSNTAARPFNFLPLDLSAYTQAQCTVKLKNNNSTSNQSGTCYNFKGNVVRSSDDAHGFNYTTTTKNVAGSLYEMPASLSQTEAVKKCSGQGIYVLTDGAPSGQHDQAKAMKNALNSSSFSCTEQAGNGSSQIATSCALAFNQKLLDTSNPAGVKIKTAVVGFGNGFSNLSSYDPKKNQEDNLLALGSIDTIQKAAAEWGIRGEGGWYSGSSSQDVVNSVNNFINSLSTDIPAVTTGSPTIARDSLNPSVLQTEAYYPQFNPTPDKTYQLWSGNLKKYNVVLGVLKDKYNNSITDSKGRIVDNYDLWAKTVIDANKDADENTVGSKKFALIGGAKSQLELRTTANTDNRKLLTNRTISGSGTSATFGNSTTLRQVKSTDLTDINYKNDANRGYLMSLLGYNVDASNPSSINLATAPELRQVGAVMHSSPILLTNKGTITYKNNVLASESREDYVLFGTTQGLLHVVDAVTGKEKFAFAPNEMVENQKQAFLEYKTTTGGTNNLFYGVDGPWTTYTEYVVDNDGALTVGTGTDYQQGTQLAYGGLRMGGRSYYALDLGNMNDPKLKFQISPADQKVYYGGSSKTFTQLQYMGQSWSKPTIAWVRWGSSRKRVMFVGGGYDAGGDDGDARTGTIKGPYAGYEGNGYNQTNKKGGGVYMFDADTGDLLWWASANATATSSATTTSGVISTKDVNLQYSVVSEIRAEDRNSDGLVDHLYFGDLGGQLFRIDLDNNAKTLGAFAKAPKMLLNLHNNTGGTSPRFYEMPAFSIYDYTGNTFAVISIGSGNRSNPLVDYTIGTTGRDYDAVYNIYDKDVTARDLFTSTYTPKLTAPLILSNLGEVTQTNRNDNTTLVAPYTGNGWYFRFRSQKPQSAKVFATPVVLNGRMLVTTFDGSKDGLSGDCGAGVKGESFLSQFCMPFGQCVKVTGSNPPECTSSDGCSVGPGIQVPPIVDDKKCNPATDPDKCTKVCDPITDPNQCKDKDGPKPDDGTNNKNYCVATGNRGAAVKDGIVSTGASHICLVPQRWYEYSSR
ncbi:PilC/PilY family type IV pilus protein [Acinetobacter sp. ANC 3832]|uniref:PilC/PilY family type IV pilus protein n=1 Tax=Acinetobacter sp. ANC 3832 TaxID=1977874 RepID=UPI000A351E87|nr:PilC/PilY family type IV pilus protein [Acinetobacter sp. ANC 3832]OTG96540.1 pilus assembly protein PilY [Acinetobacter sp. ANC 3832]